MLGKRSLVTIKGTFAALSAGRFGLAAMSRNRCADGTYLGPACIGENLSRGGVGCGQRVARALAALEVCMV